MIEYVQEHRQPGDHFLVFDPATVELYAGRDLLSTPGGADGASRVWFVASGTRQKGFPAEAQSLLDRLSEQRPQLRGIEAYGAAVYLFGPERRPGEPTVP